MNGCTHGLGVILSIVGGTLLSRRVQGLSTTHDVSCAIYTTSLLVLYTSSTLYHSFFALQGTKYIFEVLDKCAIYILIAGSYTPFLQIVLNDIRLWSVYLLGFMWTCSFLGICVEACYPTWKYRQHFSLLMYLGMGWSALVCLPEIAQRLPDGATNYIIMGGVGYTVGVPFFVRDNNLDHAIWHLFVLSGSIIHWLGIYIYVAPRPLPGSE
jgi:hemolysin III